jgi:uncharacterized protein with HEPN domain
MKTCRQIIEQIYTHPKINELIGKMQPQELQDDLRQEMAIVLLSYDCDKIIKLHEEGNLLAFTLRTIWNMATFKKGKFYKLFRKIDDKAFDYVQSLMYKDINLDSVKVAKRLLDYKLQSNPNDAHESIIFTKWVEMKSCQRVADYFGIPHLHVFQVVKKTKAELKKEIKSQL